MAESTTNGGQVLGASQFPDYNADERHYSVHVRDTLMELLKGDRDALELLTKYHQDPNRLGAPPVPRTIDAKGLRLSKVEEILSTTIHFLHDGSDGGPIAQMEDMARGVIIQQRDFPTRFPHIVIQRTDTYTADREEPIESNWCVHRIQNQRNNIRLNRALDAMTLGLELLRSIRGR